MSTRRHPQLGGIWTRSKSNLSIKALHDIKCINCTRGSSKIYSYYEFPLYLSKRVFLLVWLKPVFVHISVVEMQLEKILKLYGWFSLKYKIKVKIFKIYLLHFFSIFELYNISLYARIIRGNINPKRRVYLKFFIQKYNKI